MQNCKLFFFLCRVPDFKHVVKKSELGLTKQNIEGKKCFNKNPVEVSVDVSHHSSSKGTHSSSTGTVDR
jgi:hypothetical protein